MTALYHNCEAALPVGFQIVAETEYYNDPKKGGEKRRCPVPKNQYAREMVKQSVISQTAFRYVLADVRSASAESMMFIRHDVKKDSVMPVKTDRETALGKDEVLRTYDDRRHGRYVGTGKADFRTDTPIEIFPGEADFPMLPVKQVFADRDGSTGILYLVGSDMTLTYGQITAIYRKRRNAECYHKPLKQNASSEKSPGKIVSTQTDHFSASVCACIRLEILKFSDKLNHFALRAEICVSALHTAFAELQKLQPLKITA
jgi:hypothetical protein